MGIVVVREVAGVAFGYRRDYLAELRVVLAEYVIGELPYRIVSGQLIVRGVAFIDYIVVAPDELSVWGLDFFEEDAVMERYRVVDGIGDMIRARYITLDIAENYLRHRVALRPVVLIDRAELGVNKARRAEIGDVQFSLPAALEVAF